MQGAHKVHIAGRGSVVRQLQILVSQFRVLRTRTLSEIRPDNMYQPLAASVGSLTHSRFSIGDCRNISKNESN
jgi:hypothetical protein